MQNNISVKDILREAVQIIKSNKAYLTKVYLVSGLLFLPFLILQFVGIFFALQPVFNIYRSLNIKNTNPISPFLTTQDINADTMMYWVGTGVVIMIIAIIASYAINLGILRIQIALVDGIKTPVLSLIKSYRLVWRASISGLLSALFILLGFILLIVPGIYILIRLLFVGTAAVDPKLKIKNKEIVGYIWNLTKGRVGIIGKFFLSLFVITVISAIIVRLPVILATSLVGSDSIMIVILLNFLSTVLDLLVSIIVGLVTTFSTIILYRKIQEGSGAATAQSLAGQQVAPASAAPPQTPQTPAVSK